MRAASLVSAAAATTSRWTSASPSVNWCVGVRCCECLLVVERGGKGGGLYVQLMSRVQGPNHQLLWTSPTHAHQHPLLRPLPSAQTDTEQLTGLNSTA